MRMRLLRLKIKKGLTCAPAEEEPSIGSYLVAIKEELNGQEVRSRKNIKYVA